jgi:hypothetical protein
LLQSLFCSRNSSSQSVFKGTEHQAPSFVSDSARDNTQVQELPTCDGAALVKEQS